MLGMNGFLKAVECLKNSHVRKLVKTRIEEFRRLGSGSNEEIFKELCFCILTANFNAERSMRIQREIDDGFLTLPILQLAESLRKLGHRYPYIRAQYIVEARRYAASLRSIIERFRDGAFFLRRWLAENIRGIGYKEASHFLRNIGYTDLAIIDFHIIDILSRYGLIEKPKSIARKKYLEIENLLRDLAKHLNLTLAELDLYLWYMETGKVLK